MEPYVKNFIKKGLRSNSLDSSIFSLIRNPRTGVFLTGGDESAFDTQLDEQESVKMAKRISRSIRVLKNGYAQAVDNN
ncbi:hypothetical protein H8D85_00075 [bacterium]|nr:hypothetical protein [bacterium]